MLIIVIFMDIEVKWIHIQKHKKHVDPIFFSQQNHYIETETLVFLSKWNMVILTSVPPTIK